VRVCACVCVCVCVSSYGKNTADGVLKQGVKSKYLDPKQKSNKKIGKFT
jgi:hypothetical protein